MPPVASDLKTGFERSLLTNLEKAMVLITQCLEDLKAHELGALSTGFAVSPNLHKNKHHVMETIMSKHLDAKDCSLNKNTCGKFKQCIHIKNTHNVTVGHLLF